MKEKIITFLTNFFTSKTNWAAILIMLTGLQDYITNYSFADITPKGWITFILGAVVMIVRTWYTSAPITKFAADNAEAKKNG